MSKPFEFPILHHGKEIIMHCDCILDRPANLLILFHVIIRNVQKSSIASRLEGLGSSFKFFYKLSQAQRKGDKKIVMFFSLYLIVSLEKSAVVFAILERI